MSYYQKFEKNYWERKVFNEKNDFDLRLLKENQQQLSHEESKNLFKKYVELVCLELSYYCNRACNYCPIYTMERSDKNLEISEEVLESILRSLSEIEYDQRISLNLFNEPLASKNILKNIKYINQHVPKALISMNSNGDYIKDISYIKKLEESGLKEILITMHVPKNRKWNREYAENQLKRFSAKIGYDLNQKNLKDLNFSFLEGKLFCEVFCTDWTSSEIANSRGGLLERFNNKTRILPCEKPIREFVISYDGSIQLCCHVFHNKEYDKKLSLIEPKKNIDIFKIYSGNILAKSRRGLFDYSEKKGLCASCNHYEDNIKESAEKFFNLSDKNARSLLLNKIK